MHCNIKPKGGCQRKPNCGKQKNAHYFESRGNSYCIVSSNNVSVWDKDTSNWRSLDINASSEVILQSTIIL